jgi:acetyl-CoA decarbonylase/synthase complex subunit delta
MGHEVWKVKECKLSNEQAPELGDQKTRGVLMEAITAVSLLLAGADLLVMRHPEAVKLTKEIIQELA